MRPILILMTFAFLFALTTPVATAAPLIVQAVHQDADECAGGTECIPDHTLDCVFDLQWCRGPIDPW